MDIVRAYVNSWSPEEVARLPAGAWPTAFSTGRDVVREALKVGQVHSGFAGNRASLALLQELLLFMTQAAVRATQLAPLPGEAPSTTEPIQRPVGGKVLSEEEKKLFEAPPLAASRAKPVKDPD